MANTDDTPDLIDDDPASWVPLDSTARADGVDGAQSSDTGRRGIGADQVPWSQSVRSVVGPSSDVGAARITSRSTAVVSSHMPCRRTAVQSLSTSSSRNSLSDDLKSIRRRLETKQTLKENLVDHPLHQFAGKFVIYLVRELWRQDYYIRSGLALLTIGSVMQMFAMLTLGNTIFREYFRAIVLLIVLALSYLYVFRPDETLASAARFVTNSSITDTFLHVLENLDANQLRRVCLLFAMIPTLLEMKAVTFLAATVVEAGWIVNITVALASYAYLRHAKEKERTSSRECSIRGLACLYVSALLVAITHIQDIRRINTLAAPFVLVAGAFLVSNHPAFGGDEFDWLSRAARHALRLTLRDVLSTVGQNVGENEMLQLAMLRWVVDYWSRAPDVGGNTPQGRSGDPTTRNPTAGEHSGRTERSPEPEESASSTGNNTAERVPGYQQTERPAIAAEGSIVSQTNRSCQSTDLVRANDPDIGWKELFTMLNMTTDQMLGEVHQDHASQRESRTDESDFVEDNESVTNLQSMLASFDVDGRAKPAVAAYKATVRQFPPSRNLAIALAIMRRCPATLALLSWYSVGSYDSFCATITLLPMIWVEVMRVRGWSRSCQDAAEEESQSTSEGFNASDLIPSTMEPMIILLSSDSYSPLRPTSSMQVWANVKASVTALESGLTAMRCVQTTYVATELTFDVVSLAKFGVEVYSKGWLHGAALIARDVCHFLNHQSSGQQITRDTRGHGRYTAAAVNAARNSEVVARNVGVIMEEGGNQVIGPVGDVLAFIIGRGWLWGKDGEEGGGAKDPKTEGEDDKNEPKTADQTPASSSRTDDCELKHRSDYPSDVGKESEHETTKCDDAVNSSDTGTCREKKSKSEAYGVKEQEETCCFEATSMAEGRIDGEKGGGMKVNYEEDETAETLQLMSEALEKGLITEKEKDNFVEMLLAEKKKEAGVNDSYTVVKSAAGIRKSLECLLESSVENFTENKGVAIANDKFCAKEDGEDEISQNEEVAGAKHDTSEENSVSSDGVATVPLAASAATIESWENTGIGNDLVFDGENDASDHQGTPKKSNAKSIPEAYKGELPTANKVENVFEDDEDDEGSWTEIDREGLPISNSSDHAAAPQPFGSQSIRSMTEDKKEKTPSSSPKSQNDNKEDWMKWVGGSLAVAGGLAVAVGGIALANTNNQDSENRRTSHRSEMKNTVTIELLDSDDES